MCQYVAGSDVEINGKILKKYIITAKGTGRGPIGASMEYDPGDNWLNDQYPDASYWVDQGTGSSCGSWDASPTVIPSCTSNADGSTISWTIVHTFHSDLHPVTLKPTVNMNVPRSLNGHTTDIEKDVTCS